jgi:hypothetical protein
MEQKKATAKVDVNILKNPFQKEYNMAHSAVMSRKIPRQGEPLDELEKIISEYIARTRQHPKFIQGAAFVTDSELVVDAVEDDASALTAPTVFSDDASGLINQLPLKSHQVDDYEDPILSQENYLDSTEELSPDVDFVRSVARDCMKSGSDEQAIEVLRQALNGTDSLDLVMFCLTSLWVLVRKSDENKRTVLFGLHEETECDDDTPFAAIIDAMIKFPSAEVQSKACGALWSLSMNPSYRKDVAQLGGCQAIVQAMLMHTSDEHLQVVALGALKVLSCHVAGKSSLVLIDTSLIVSDIMETYAKNPTIQTEGCAIICNLATGVNKFVRPVTKNEINAIVKSILSLPESAALHEEACYTLMSLSSQIVNAELMLQNINIFDALELAFQKHPRLVGDHVRILLKGLRIPTKASTLQE